MEEKEREEKLLKIRELQNSRDTLQQELDEIGEISLEGVNNSKGSDEVKRYQVPEIKQAGQEGDWIYEGRAADD